MKLPAPGSPGKLDEKILAYAKRNTPPARPFFRPVWVSGLTAASIVAVAVLIAIPQQPQPGAVEADLQPMEAAPFARSVGAQKSVGEIRNQTLDMAAELAPIHEAVVTAKAMQVMSSPEVLDTMDNEEVQMRMRKLSLLDESFDPNELLLEFEVPQSLCPDCELPEKPDSALDPD